MEEGSAGEQPTKGEPGQSMVRRRCICPRAKAPRGPLHTIGHRSHVSKQASAFSKAQPSASASLRLRPPACSTDTSLVKASCRGSDAGEGHRRRQAQRLGAAPCWLRLPVGDVPGPTGCINGRFRMSLALLRGVCHYLYTLWEYRYFWLSLVKADLRRRYHRSILGVCWSLLNPIFMTATLCVVYRHVFNVPASEFGPFLLTGLAF